MTISRSRRAAVAMGAVLLAAVLGRQVWYYAAGPSGDKDCSPAASPPAGVLSINDVSCLNPTPVSAIVDVRTEEDIRLALASARERQVGVSIAGARHSQGGHAFATNNVVLDMRRFNGITVDETAATMRVQSGATWHDIQERLHPRFAVKAMQSTDLFTVGGSISVNAHGMDHQAGSVGRTVRSMRVMLADGSVRTVSRAQDSDLFRLVVGGYGLFGIILDADIEITANSIYRSGRQVMDYTAFPEYFAGTVSKDPAYRLVYAHLSTAPHSFLRETLVYTYQDAGRQDTEVPALGGVSGVWLRRLVFNLSKLGPLPMRLKWWAEKYVEPRLESCPAGEVDGCLVSRNDPMHDSVPYLMNRLDGETDILQEYFVPRDRLVPFVDGLRRIALANRANLLNASIRVVHEEDNLLTYAPGPMFAVVLYVNQKTDEEGTGRMARFTRELIDLTIGSGGRFFLPYQLHYSPEQLRRSYPEIQAFFQAKDTYDPEHLLTNTFYNTYAPAILAAR